MKKLLSRYLSCLVGVVLVAAVALSPPAAARTVDDEQELVFELLHGFFLAATHDYAAAAEHIGEIGRQRQDADIMQRAVRFAIQSNNIRLARQYAQLWLQYGGGFVARQALAELHIMNKELAEAEAVLATLMADGEQSTADLFQQLRVVEDSAAAIAMGRRLFPSSAKGQLDLARLALSAGDFAAVLEAVENSHRHDKGAPDGHFMRAYVIQRDGGDAAAVLPLLEAYARANCYGGVKYCELNAVLWAYSLFLNGRHEWREGLSAETAAREEWTLRAAELLENWQMPERARAEYQKIAADSFMANLGLARIARTHDNDAAAALAILRAAEVKEARHFVLRELQIARLLVQQDDVAAATARLRAAQQTVPENFSLLYQHALILEDSDDIDGALAMLRELPRLFPDNPDAWNALGYVMADHGVDLKTAQSYIERALQLRPEDPNIIDSLGWVHYRLGNLARAQRHLEKAASVSQAAEIAAHLGEVLWVSGDMGAAKRVWREALARDADNDVLNETLARYRPF